MAYEGYVFTFTWGGATKTIPVVLGAFKTTVNKSETEVDLVSIGSSILLKDIALREMTVSMLLPRDKEWAVNQDEWEEPIKYLNFFRNWRISKEPAQMVILRWLPDGTQIFNGNMPVILSKYTVEEAEGEPGDFYVDLSLKEYRTIKVTTETPTGETDEDGNTLVTSEEVRDVNVEQGIHMLIVTIE